MKAPNVLILFADDQRFNTINALNNDEIITPNLDRLVASGTAFTHAHIQGGTCGAVCMASRAMLNTGRSLFKLDDLGQQIPDDHTLMGEFFKARGYDTFGTGKWHNGKKSFNRSFDQGDSIFFGGMSDHWAVPFYHYDSSAEYNKVIRKCVDQNHSNEVKKTAGEYMRAGEHSTDVIAESVIKFLDQKHDKPFFAYTSFLAPHDPRTMPEEFLNMYNPEDIKLPPNFMSYHFIEYANWECRDETLAPYPRTLANTQKHIAEYYAMITHLDYQIGRILDKLEEIGEKDNTIIVYAGDNGLALGQHGLFGKQSLYDHSMRVPLLISGAGIKAGMKTDALVYLFDIFPTLCDLLEQEIPASVTGQSFAECIKGTKDAARDQIYLAYTDKIRAITKDGFKYIEHRYNGIITKQLFDLNSDPFEMSNLVLNPNYQEKLVALQKALQAESQQSNELNHNLGKNYWA
ncbi:sulfatase-like hydrolase/transferase [Candidatus Epulonipiscium viviparus]|uniref:sulfatase-like hydrolase/transferase n=1 Tax=Candidatus Epulonipiscium viviparus TaxID=420336 RepID=UPI0027380F0E|nr:sulfatase-like hydrolase/transferase [Candidatus Epulopiscium viviparus]